jgi:hypothetical protein
MAFTYRLVQARTAYSVVAVNTNVTLVTGDSVVAVLIKVTGASARTGGAPTLAGVAMTQASTAQFAAASPEAGAELWYTLNPNAAGSTALTIPDGNAVAGFYTVVSGQASTGVAGLTNAAGANGTSTNPAPGSITPTAAGDIGFAIVASGATTWNPSPQAGTVIANTDDGAHGGGEQYVIAPNTTGINLGWTFGTSDDWGAVAVFFKEAPPRPIPDRKLMIGQAVRRASYY